MIDLDSIIRTVSPDSREEESLTRAAQELLELIGNEIRKEKLDAEPVLVGSVSKRTYLDPDVDVFICFDRKIDREAMVAAALKIGHAVLPDAVERYAEHPYVSGHIGGVKADVVPCYRIGIGEKIISAVDRSPLHTRYVLDNITDEERGQVRLLKAFMKTAGIYGSEVSTRGFSGYVCELLIIKHRTFLATLKSFSSARGRYIISDGEVNLKKFTEPVIIIDPVDESRNAAAAISLENFSRMQVISREFLANPTADYFSRKRTQTVIEMDRGTTMRIFRLPSTDVVPDTIFPQAERFRGILVDILEEGGFFPIASELVADDYVDILIECRSPLSPKFFIHGGPPADSVRTRDFIEKWKTRNDVIGPYVIGNRLYADVPAKQVSIEEYVARRLPEFNIGAHLNDLKGELQIIDPSETPGRYSVLEKFFSRTI